MATLRIGASGWSYRHWKDRFYPPGTPQKAWLEFYASRFDTVEINASFYYLPVADTFASWQQRTPPSFRFAVKAPRQITHWRRLLNSEQAVEVFLERAHRLEDKLGPILFQLPPRWPADPPRLKSFLALLPRKLRCAFEFRDPSWFSDEVLDLLRESGIALCRSSSNGFPDLDTVTAPFVYLRMHGGRHSPEYSRAELVSWAQQVANWLVDSLDVYVYFNNDANAYALQNAQTLASLLDLQPAASRAH